MVLSWRDLDLDPLAVTNRTVSTATLKEKDSVFSFLPFPVPKNSKKDGVHTKLQLQCKLPPGFHPLLSLLLWPGVLAVVGCVHVTYMYKRDHPRELPFSDDGWWISGWREVGLGKPVVCFRWQRLHRQGMAKTGCRVSTVTCYSEGHFISGSLIWVGQSVMFIFQICFCCFMDNGSAFQILAID